MGKGGRIFLLESGMASPAHVHPERLHQWLQAPKEQSLTSLAPPARWQICVRPRVLASVSYACKASNAEYVYTDALKSEFVGMPAVNMV